MDLGQGTRDAPRRAGGKRCCGLPDAEDAREVARTLGIRHYTANYRERFREAVDRAVRRRLRGGAHADPVRRLQPRAEVRPAAAACRGARRVRAWPRVTTRASRPRPTAGPGSSGRATSPRTRATSCSTCRATRCAGSRSRSASSRKRRCARSRASSGSSPRTSPRARGSASSPTATCAARSRGCAPERPRVPGPIATRDGRDPGRALGRGRLHARASATGSVSRAGPGTWPRCAPPRTRSWSRARRSCTRREVRASSARRGSTARRPAGRVRAAVRYRHRTVSARVRVPSPTAARALRFEEPVWAPAPGQAAVVYDAADQRVLGGGWITASG